MLFIQNAKFNFLSVIISRDLDNIFWKFAHLNFKLNKFNPTRRVFDILPRFDLKKNI